MRGYEYSGGQVNRKLAGSDGDDWAAEKFARELRTLYEAAGRPTLKQLVCLGRRQSPPVSVSDSAISDWLSGRAVPVKHVGYVLAMITFLQSSARTDPGYQFRPEAWWQQLLKSAQDERLAAKRGGRPGKMAASRRVPGAPAPLLIAETVLLGPGGQVPDVAGAGLRELGVHPAARGLPGAAPAGDLAEMPPYVCRDCDTGIDAAVLGGGLVILEGRSAAGKSRAAAEAIRRTVAGRQLLVPRDGPALRTLAKPGARVHDAVIWLDDLERYIGDQSLDVHTLNRLCPPGATDVVVVATLRSEARRALESQLMPYSQSAASAQRLFEAAVTIRVPFQTSEPERERAEDHRSDPRIAAWLDQPGEAGLPEYLAAGPAAVQRWLSGRDGGQLAGAALVSAAVDCRRAGFDKPVTRRLLSELHQSYLDPRDAHRPGLTSLDDAFIWAAEPVHGASSCLIPHAEGRYRAFDYLVDHMQRDTAAPPVPVSAWRIIAAHATGDDIGFVTKKALEAAITTHTPEIADIALIRLGECQGVEPVFDLVSTFYLLGMDSSGPRHFSGWLRRFAEPGNPTAMAVLGDMLLDEGALEEGEVWLRRAAGEGNADAIARMALLLRERNDARGMQEWLDDALAKGHAAGVIRFASWLHEQDRQAAEAERWLRRAADAGDSRAMGIVGTMLQERGDPEEAKVWYHKAAERGYAAAMTNLGVIYIERGELTAAEHWLEKAADAGDTVGIYNLARFRLHQGDRDDEAERLLKEAIDADYSPALTALALLLYDRGELPSMTELLTSAIARHQHEAVTDFATTLVHRGQKEDAERWYCVAAEAGHATAMAGLGTIYAERAGGAAGRPWFEKAAQLGDTTAMLNLGHLHRRAGEIADARKWFQQAADNGDTRAIQALQSLP